MINDQIKAFIDQGKINPNIGIAKEPIPVEITAINRHALKHGVTLEDAQSYVNNAVVMFDQGNRSLYISLDGNAVLLDSEKRLISAYKKEDFDLGTLTILEVITNGDKI
ncbi:MAG: hypothetical protein FWG88_03485 [Oscillospiraceae bacterium]|nr:hypothetical protein [Oscillospiraceae bacterium]